MKPHTPLPNPLPQTARERGSIYKPLLHLLHTAIAQAQKYPEQAMELGQSGQVTVRFLLSPRGDISNIQIQKSSGIPALDQAAMTAIQAINPFSPAGGYLKAEQVFSIDIQFQV